MCAPDRDALDRAIVADQLEQEGWDYALLSDLEEVEYWDEFRRRVDARRANR